MTTKNYILTISCKDAVGIVAAVSGVLAKNNCFILESAQFGDTDTGKFFMRCVFSTANNAPNEEELKAQFADAVKSFEMQWDIIDREYKPRLLIMVSKYDHCLNDILHRYLKGTLQAEIVGVISNHNSTQDMVQWHKIPFYYLPVTRETKMEQEAEIWKICKELDIDLVVLARYMQILTPSLTAKLHGKALNIHHSFLPSFKGAKPYHQAYEKGVKLIGATAHFVTDDLDEGPIIEQEVTRVDHTHNPDELVALGCDIESKVLSNAVRYYIEHRVLLNNKKTIVFK